MTVRTRKPGDTLAIRAAEWNTIARVVNARDRAAGPLGPPTGFAGASGWVYVRNDTGAAVTRFQPLAVSGPLMVPADQGEFFLERPAFAVDLCEEDDLIPGAFVVAAESIEADQVGRAFVGGVHAIQADIVSTGHRFLRTVDGEALLQSCAQGIVPLLTVPAGTGTQGVIASLTPDGRPLRLRAKITLATEISGANNRWAYDWQEVTWSGNAPVPSNTSGGRVSTTAGLAYNTIEGLNDASGIQGNGIDLATLPSGFENVPLGVGAGVELLGPFPGTTAGVKFWLFQAVNTVDGECAS